MVTGPTQGGDYGPYVQSERIPMYWQMVQLLLQVYSILMMAGSYSQVQLWPATVPGWEWPSPF